MQENDTTRDGSGPTLDDKARPTLKQLQLQAVWGRTYNCHPPAVKQVATKQQTFPHGIARAYGGPKGSTRLQGIKARPRSCLLQAEDDLLPSQ